MTGQTTPASAPAPAGYAEEIDDLVALVAPAHATAQNRADIRTTLERLARSYLSAMRDEKAGVAGPARDTMKSLGKRADRIHKELATIQRAKAEIAAAARIILAETQAAEADLHQLPNAAEILVVETARTMSQPGHEPDHKAAAEQDDFMSPAQIETLKVAGGRVAALITRIRPRQGSSSSPVVTSPLGKLTWEVGALIRALHGPGSVTVAKDGMAASVIRGLIIYATGDPDRDPVDSVVRHLRGALEASRPADLSPGWGLRSLVSQIFKLRR